MPRRVTLVLASPCGQVLGALPGLDVASPWWPDVEPVVAAARQRLGVDVIVLRLLHADRRSRPGGTGSYLAEVNSGPPARPLADDDPLRLLAEREDPLRMPWARAAGVAADAAWADDRLAAAGTP